MSDKSDERSGLAERRRQDLEKAEDNKKRQIRQGHVSRPKEEVLDGYTPEEGDSEEELT